MKGKQRLLALFLMFVLCLGLLPFSAFAAEPGAGPGTETADESRDGDLSSTENAEPPENDAEADSGPAPADGGSGDSDGDSGRQDDGNAGGEGGSAEAGASTDTEMTPHEAGEPADGESADSPKEEEPGESTMTERSAECGNFSVTVSYDGNAGLPDDASLVVTELPEDSAVFQTLKEAALAERSPDDTAEELPESITLPGIDGPVYVDREGMDGDMARRIGVAVLDISLVDADGNELEPQSSVDVTVEMTGLEEKADEMLKSLEVIHHKESEDAGETIVVENMVTEAEDASTVKLDFSVDSFSQFTILWNTNPDAKINVYYGYMDGNTFVEFEDHGEVPEWIGGDHGFDRENYPYSEAFLSYDFAGYRLKCSYLCSREMAPGENPAEYRVRQADGPMLYRRYTYEQSPDDDTWCYLFFLDSEDAMYVRYLLVDYYIYIVYEPEQPATPGGKPAAIDRNVVLEQPSAIKNVTANGDGTLNLSLSITGSTKPMEEKTKADVVIILDLSHSMDGEDVGFVPRLPSAKEAIRLLTEILLGENGPKDKITGQPLVRLSLVTFSPKASIETFDGQYYTSDAAAFIERVQSLQAHPSKKGDGSTNWENALFKANRIPSDPDAATFVVFVSDGDPTTRDTRGNYSDVEIADEKKMGYYNYPRFGVFGNGNSKSSPETVDICFRYATDDARAIVMSGKSLYTISAFGESTRMKALTDAAYGGVSPDGHSIDAEDGAALKAAFQKIAGDISGMVGFTKVSIHDGVTPLTNLAAKVNAEQGADVWPDDGFRYTVTENGVTTDWDPAAHDAGLARYDPAAGEIVWDFGDRFYLKSGVTYTVNCTVWPSQEAYDTVAALNNGKLSFDALSPALRAQLTPRSADENGKTYWLKTNTDTLYAEYKQSTVLGDLVTPIIYYAKEKPAALPQYASWRGPGAVTYGRRDQPKLSSIPLTVKKEWDDALTGGADRGTVTLEVKGDEAVFAEISLNGSEEPAWTGSAWIAPGLKTLHDGVEITYEKGHDYRLDEKENSVRYRLEAEGSLHPMLVNDVLPDGESFALTARNVLFSWIDVTKTVLTPSGGRYRPANGFRVNGWLRSADGRAFAVDCRIIGADGETVSEQKFSSENVSFILQAGQTARFLNVPENASYAFWEAGSEMPVGFFFESAAGEVQTAGGVLSAGAPPAFALEKNGGGDVVATGTVAKDSAHIVRFVNRMTWEPKTVPTVSPRTGDGNSASLWLSLGALSLAGLLAVLRKKRRLAI